MTRPSWNRRDAIQAGIALGIAPRSLLADAGTMLTRSIPTSDEQLPVIGLGTWQVFDVAGSDEELDVRKAIVSLLIDKGGSVIDSSPMYARSEKIVGEIIEDESNRERLFLATKVWTDGKDRGETQMQRSIDLMQAGTIDLMQVHNLRDLDVHMGTIRDWQKDGLIRYSGITDYRASALDEIETAMRVHKPQFIQINYSLAEREAEKRVLPLAADLGIAVLINRPFVSGGLFRAVRNLALPEWAKSYADSWGQFFLKFIVSHPAVTCVIPATSKLHHMSDNVGAGFGEMPDEAFRQRMAAYIESI
ncbi:MAG: diketogulonate reductase-like aldo/keto reductase [Woeseiaceae bacterium]|jgi:diketogulonate reductase-like aldo/keto reductase